MHVQTPHRVMAGHPERFLLLALSTLSLAACATVHARNDAEPRRLPTLIGSWAFSPDSGSRPERDTTVWEIRADGHIRYAQVHRGRVRTLSYARRNASRLCLGLLELRGQAMKSLVSCSTSGLVPLVSGIRRHRQSRTPRTKRLSAIGSPCSRAMFVAPPMRRERDTPTYGAISRRNS